MDTSPSELHLFCPPFHGLANEVHFHEPDKFVYIKRLSVKLVPLDCVQMHPGECRALAHKVNKLLMFLLAESTDLLRDITCYIMVIIEINMSCYGLQGQAKGGKIQASQGITQATRLLQPELGLAPC